MDVALQTFGVLKVHNTTIYTKIQKLKGGRSSYKLIVSLKLTAPAMQRYRNFNLDVGVPNLYSVLQDHNAHHIKMQKFQGGRSRYKLVLSVVKFTTPTIQTYFFTHHWNARVGVT